MDIGLDKIQVHLDKLAPLLGPLEVRARRMYVTEAERQTARVESEADDEPVIENGLGRRPQYRSGRRDGARRVVPLVRLG